MDEAKEDKPIFRDIRRYFCDYCGICRSKKALITSHILTDHKDELDKVRAGGDNSTEGLKESKNTCEKCGLTFKKAAYLKQHMLSHSTERPHVCPVDDCPSSYRRKDHLNRHLLIHKGKLFKCPIENCKSEFSVKANIKRHVEELHNEGRPSPSTECENTERKHVCQEAGCGKAFAFPSRLRKHEQSHVKLESIEALCAEPGCMKVFTNEQCLKDHIQLCHRHISCKVCGSKHLKKNMKRHLRTHERKSSFESIKCLYKGCLCTFSTKSNLNQHLKAVHFNQKPYVCGFSGCSMRFAYKHVRDNHEKSSCHVYTHGDFEEADEQFRSRPRGGRKRKYPSLVELLVRKRITPPNDLDGLFECSDNLSCG
ncbi:hypothetical protein CsatB_009973 [Cannabis sativa]